MDGALLSAKKYGCSEDISGLKCPGPLTASLLGLVQVQLSEFVDMDTYAEVSRPILDATKAGSFQVSWEFNLPLAPAMPSRESGDSI